MFVARGEDKLLCCNPLCVLSEDRDAFQAIILTLEPYYHWDTLAFASDLRLAQGKIVAFRRTGPKSKQHLWVLELKRLEISRVQAPSYCIRCLETFMADRVAGESFIEQAKETDQQESCKPGWDNLHPAFRPSELMWSVSDSQMSHWLEMAAVTQTSGNIVAEVSSSIV